MQTNSLLLLFGRMLDRVFVLKLSTEQGQQARDVFLDMFKTLDALAEGYDLFGDRGPLCLVVGQYIRVDFVADLIAKLGSLLLQG